MSSKVLSWAASARQDDPWDPQLTEKTVDMLASLLLGNEDADSLAASLASLFNPMLQCGRVEAYGTLWAAVCDAIVKLGGDLVVTRSLVALINALGRLPDVQDDNGQTVTAPGYLSKFWQDLPCLAIDLRDLVFDWYKLGKSNRFGKLW